MASISLSWGCSFPFPSLTFSIFLCLSLSLSLLHSLFLSQHSSSFSFSIPFDDFHNFLTSITLPPSPSPFQVAVKPVVDKQCNFMVITAIGTYNFLCESPKVSLSLSPFLPLPLPPSLPLPSSLCLIGSTGDVCLGQHPQRCLRDTDSYVHSSALSLTSLPLIFSLHLPFSLSFCLHHTSSPDLSHCSQQGPLDDQKRRLDPHPPRVDVNAPVGKGREREEGESWR